MIGHNINYNDYKLFNRKKYGKTTKWRIRKYLHFETGRLVIGLQIMTTYMNYVYN